ncbi:MAG: GNAT family N-acetyltransferase [Solobacterium sp.]|nr:GNAT family N-acetyltransferase [Solobacterium sp.]
MDDKVTIRSERISAKEYTGFLKRSDLGSQYPAERFAERIGRLVDSVQISLSARNEDGLLVGVLFGLTDFSYWLFITDLGVDRDHERKGIGRRLMQEALRIAGGEKDIAVYLVANDAAMAFYEKLGMEKAEDVMQYNRIDWTPFKAGSEKE